MKHGVKSVLVMAIACALALGLAACGGGDGETTQSGSSGDQEVSGKVTIWDAEYELLPNYTKAIDQIVEEFEDLHPKVTIDHVAQPNESWEPIYRAAFAAHQGPDIMEFPGSILSFKNGLEVLNDRVTPAMQEEITLWQTVSVGYEEDGEHVGVPIGLNGWAFYYNKKLFAKAGLPTEFEPKTWAEVREAGEKLNEAGIQPFTGGNKEGYENSFWFGVGYDTLNSPEQITELGEGEIEYTDEQVAKGFGPQAEMYDAGLFPSDYFSTLLAPDGYQHFAEGKGAMVLGFWNALGYWGEFNPELGEENVGTFLPPENGGALGTIASQMWGIPTFAENKDAAWAFLEFLSSERGNEVLAEVGGFIPNRKGVGIPANAPVQERDLLDASRERGTSIAAFAVLPSGVANFVIPAEISQVLQGRTSLESAQQAIQEVSEKASGG